MLAFGGSCLRESLVWGRTMSTVALPGPAGVKGGSVQNPINALAAFIAGLHLPNRTISVAGFYE